MSILTWLGSKVHLVLFYSHTHFDLWLIFVNLYRKNVKNRFTMSNNIYLVVLHIFLTLEIANIELF